MQGVKPSTLKTDITRVKEGVDGIRIGQVDSVLFGRGISVEDGEGDLMNMSSARDQEAERQLRAESAEAETQEVVGRGANRATQNDLESKRGKDLEEVDTER